MKYVGVKTTGELRLHEVKEPQTDEIYMAVEDTKVGASPIKPYQFVKWDGTKWVEVPDVQLATDLDVSEAIGSLEGKIPSDTSTTNKLVNESGLQDAIDNASESWSTGFTPKGESSVSDLNDLATQSNGDSYIVTDSGTLTDGSLAVVAGDQVAWDATNSVWYKLPQYAMKQFGTNTIKDLATTKYKGFMALDDADGTGKMDVDTIFNNFAGKFDPTRTSTNPYKAGESVVYEGKTYTFRIDHYGAWAAADVRQATIFDFILANGSNDLNAVAGNIVLVNGKYYAVSSSTTTIPTNTSSNAAFSCALMFVKAAQKYKITCTGTSSALPFAFFDSTGAAVYKHTSVNARGLEYTFPSDGIAIFNNVNSSSVAYDIHLVTPNEVKCDILSGKVDVLERDNESLYSGLKLETGYYYAIDSSTSTMPANHYPTTGWESLKIPVKAGESYSVTSRGSSSAIPWSLWKSNGDLVSNSGTITVISGAVVNVEYDGYLIINSITSYGNLVYKRNRIDKKELSIRDKLLYWTMAEAYVLDGTATYTDGLIDSPVNVTMPDGTAANLIILRRTSEGLITRMQIQSLTHGVLITLVLTRDADGNVTAMTIS